TPDAPGIVQPLSYMTQLGCALLLVLISAVGAARAEEPYPTRPIRLVVGFGAGGPTDIPARFVADKLGGALGQRRVLGNTRAAAGVSALRGVPPRARDVSTRLLRPSSTPINPPL